MVRKKNKIDSGNDVAIVGMACIVPGAPDPKIFWQNIVNKVDAVSDPPEDWGGEPWYDPDSTDNDRIYCKRGGYLGDLARFDPLQYGIMPNTVDGAEPEHFLALKVASAALDDAGVPAIALNRERTEVILGRGTFVNRGYTSLHQHGLVIEQTLRLLKQLHPEYSAEHLDRIKKQLKKGLPPFNAQIAPGLVSTIMTGRVANRLDLKGCNYSVDASCSSSLIAVEHGIQDLLSGKCDAVIAGGVQLSTHQLILMVFSQLGALSKTFQIRPFDAKADGTLLGEGLGMMVLKRLADAERDGNRIYAVLKTVASASDGKGKSVVAPRVEGESLALRRAYEKAAIAPESIGLIEAHGTAMPLGDATEIEGLGLIFGSRKKQVPTCAVGTVKSMIAHLIPASGIAGLIKTALALYHKTLPPSLHCDEPNPKLGLDSTPFYINTETRPWIHGGKNPRRAGVNAFGFGGINAHAILEEYVGDNQAEDESYAAKWDTELCVFAGDLRTELVSRCEQVLGYLKRCPSSRLLDVAYSLSKKVAKQKFRLAIVASSVEDLIKKLDHAISRLKDKNRKRIKEKKGIYFFENQLAEEGKIAFLYPGEGSQYVNMLSDLCLHFPVVRSCFDNLDRALSDLSLPTLPSQVIFPPPSLPEEEKQHLENQLWDMEYAVDSVITADRALTRLLAELGITADAMVGHSSGEFMALEASGAIGVKSEAELMQHIRTGHEMIQQLADTENIHQAQLMAMGPVDRDAVEQLIKDNADSVYLAMDNCPHQVIVCAAQDMMEEISRKMRGSGTICQTLSFNRPYHTSLYEPACGPLEEFYDSLPMQKANIPLYSCMSGAVMPDDLQEMRRLAVGQWARMVRFRETIEAMYEDGIRIFLEVGPKAHLTGFVSDTLKGKDALAVPMNVHHRSGLSQLHHALGLLAAHGVSMALESLFRRRKPESINFAGENAEQTAKPAMPLALDLPLLTLDEADLAALRLPSAAGSDDKGAAAPAVARQSVSGTSRAMLSYFQTMERFLLSQQQVMQAYLDSPAPADQFGQHTRGKENVSPLPCPPAGYEKNEGEQKTAEKCALNKEDTEATSQAAPLPGHSVKELLLELVSEKTGYPVDMLDLDQDLEADLGIDSIKRVEILAAFTSRADNLDSATRERIGKCKTLQQILDSVSKSTGENTEHTPYPFLREIISHIPAQRLTARCQLDLTEDIFLFDHTLGRNLSEADPGLQGLPIMPLTMSMEMMAEAGAMLFPGKVLVGMADLRAYRWITFDKGKQLLEVEAHCREDGAARVVLREASAAGENSSGGLPILEAVMFFADSYPSPPDVTDFVLQEKRPSVWKADTLYAEGMFSGPCFQGVASVERWGTDGIEATLQTLPYNRFFSSDTEPHFVTDPVLLDAAGQLIAYWIADHRTTGFNVYPFRMEALHFYGPNFTAAEKIKSRARILPLAENQLRSTIELIDSVERMHLQITGWDDRSFDLPQDFYQIRFRPAEVFLSKEWSAPLIGLAENGHCICRRMEDFADDLLHSHGGVWHQVLAFLALSDKERHEWRNLPEKSKRRNQWLLARIAAKDAVRLFLKERYDKQVCMADVIISADEYGRPLVRVAGQQLDLPSLSLSHSGGTGVALLCPSGKKIGVDLEKIENMNDDVLSGSFTEQEKELVEKDPEKKDEWALRLWCAKEACAKALGRGLPGGPLDLNVRQIDRKTGRISLAVQGELAGLLPHRADNLIDAFSGIENKDAFATVLIEGVENDKTLKR